ncbi:MAG: hypothetical protein M1821_001873 [Bathelium mastoideum]|nr:MAG: hypothetical protein M1821_001873 [Bathelium mastoideum]
MAQPETKRQKTEASYELLYWPGIPGRGEFVRLAFEASGAPYTDVGNEVKDGARQVIKASTEDVKGGNPPGFAPPALRAYGAGRDGKDLLIHQTPNILLYLGPKLGLVPDDEPGRLWVNELTLTALDLNNEAHNTHHPIAHMAYYEEQKDEAVKNAKEFREARIPKYFSYFESVLKNNEKSGGGRYLVDDKLTYADTAVFHVVDGLSFAFPKEIEAVKKDYPLLFTKLYDGVKSEQRLKDYLASDRRKPYSMGIFRHYPELDRQ